MARKMLRRAVPGREGAASEIAREEENLLARECATGRMGVLAKETRYRAAKDVKSDVNLR